MCYTGAMQFANRPGFGSLGFFGFLILLIMFLVLVDMGYIFLSQKCIDSDIIDCILDVMSMDEEEEEQPEEGSVTATSAISREVKGSMRTVTISITFPLEGGAVTGSFEGDCDGSIKGTYAGGTNGAISGTGKGSCGFIFPASGTFSGTVNKGSKSVSVSGEASVMGVSGQGSLTLKY